jgi:uncharacterized protein (TIGR00251 family)
VTEGFVRPSNDGALLSLRVSPGAKESSLEGTYGENALKLRVAAPPVDGRANAEVERFLAEILDFPRKRVAVRRGASGRDKVVLIEGAGPEELLERLSRLVR